MSDEATVQLSAKILQDLEELEEIVECSVCLEPPQGHVRLCRRGHHFCQTCRERLEKCPVCRSAFLVEARNIGIEQIAAKLDEMRALQPLAPPIDPPAPNVRCCIGFCPSRVPGSEMCDHVKVRHPKEFLELIDLDPTRSTPLCWASDFSFEYHRNSCHRYGLKSPSDDFFFGLATIDGRGRLGVEIQIAHFSGAYRSFAYQISIEYLDELTIKGPEVIDGKVEGRPLTWRRRFFDKYYEDDYSGRQDATQIRCCIFIHPRVEPQD